MISREKLNSQLEYFTGTQQFYYLPLFRKFRYTDGIKFLAREAECYWLLEFIFLAQDDIEVSSQVFQTWKIKVNSDNSCNIHVEDGNHNIVKSFEQIPFTDFPLESMELWFVNKTLMLKSEY